MKPLRGAAREQSGAGSERRGDVPVGRIRWVGQQQFVFGVEQSRQQQHERARRAGRDDDAVGLHLQSKSVPVEPTDGLAQGRDSERRCVARAARLQCDSRGLNHAFGRGEIGLADAQMHDRAAGSFEALGLLDQLHHEKRSDRVATLRDHQTLGSKTLSVSTRS